MYINVSKIIIPYDEFLIRAGIPKSAHASVPQTQTASAALEMYELAQKLIKPKAAVVFDEIKISGNNVNFKDGFKIESAQIAKLLDGCFKAYGAAVTIGPDLEKKRNDFIEKKETLMAFLLDSAGSVAAEEIIRSVNEQIKAFESLHNNLTVKRFSPGYGDWQLQSQKEFLKWTGARQIGIDLNASFQMKPEKSVSAIIGIRKGS